MINTKCISLIGGINSPTSRQAGWSSKRWVGSAPSRFPSNKSRLLHLAYRFKILETELLIFSLFFSLPFSFLSFFLSFFFCKALEESMEKTVQLLASATPPRGEAAPTPALPSPHSGFPDPSEKPRFKT